MPLIPYPDLDDVDEQTAELLDQQRTDSGEVPSFGRMLANNPAILKATSGQFFEVVYGGGLGVPIKQLAFVTVSQENDCAYCAATHGAELVNALGLPEHHLDAIAAEDDDEFTDRQRAVVAFARQAARDPKRITQAHVDDLRSVGFDDADVLELVTVTAQANFANTIVDALNIHPGDQSPDLDDYLPEDLAGGVVEATESS